MFQAFLTCPGGSLDPTAQIKTLDSGQRGNLPDAKHGLQVVTQN